MFIYSAHDANVGTLVRSLDAYDLTQPPPYGATVFFELHERDEVFGLEVKIKKPNIIIYCLIFFLDILRGLHFALSSPLDYSWMHIFLSFI